MSDEPKPVEQAESDPNPAVEDEPAWKRRARLAAVFGDVLPDSTRDDRDPESASGGTSEEWLKRQVPPHHG